jgi:glycine/D-amino acid oxidase-like deaminating enzyme
MLDGDKRVSVAVIGGGFTGLSAALHLAERGVDVAVLEANEPGWGASGRNGGQVNPGLKHDPDVVEQDFGSDLGRRMVALSGNAPNVVFGLIQRHQIECQALQSGTLRAAVSRRAAAGIRATTAQWAQRDAPVELLDAAALRQVTGSTRYATAVLDRRGGQVNPLGYARGLAQAAMQAGAAVFGGTPARRAQRNGTVWEITTPTGTVRAEKLVLGPMPIATICGRACGAPWCRCSVPSSLRNRCPRRWRARSCRRARCCTKWAASPCITGWIAITGC